MKQLARKEQESPGFVEALMRRLRGIAGRPEADGGLREQLEELIEETSEDSEARELSEQERELLLNALSFGGIARGDEVVVLVPAIVAPRPSASLAGADKAPKLMPAMVIGILSSMGFFA